MVAVIRAPGGAGTDIAGSGRRCLDIDDDGVLGVDQIVEPIAELHRLVLPISAVMAVSRHLPTLNASAVAGEADVTNARAIVR